jgi:hypothetical protein
MKALAAIALIGLASASEDNELFKFNNTKLNFPHHNHNATARPQPIHHRAQNATVQPKPIRKVHPILFNRNHTAHIAKPQNEKKPVLKTFDDEELFFADNIPENQLNNKGIGKFADRNKEWLAPVGHKVLDKLLSSFDDDELFNADINDDELAGFFGKVGSFVGKNKNVIVPMATKLMGKFDDEELHTISAEKKNVLASTFNKLLGKLDDDELHTLFLGVAAQNKNVVTSTWNKLLGNLDSEFSDEELASFFGKVGSFVAKNKNIITPVATKLIGRLDSEDDYEFRSTTGQVASQSKNVVGSIFNKLLGNLDDEFDTDELAFLGSYNRILQKNGPAVAKIGVKALPLIALDGFNEEELFNLDAFLNDAVRTYNDARQNPRNYGNLVNDGIKLVKDIKQKDDEDTELFNFNAFLNDAIKTYNDARSQPRNYGNLVNDGIQLVKDIKQKKQDDEELFNLGNLINDGLNIYGDIKSKNYGGLVNHGIQTVKDIKKHDDDEFHRLKCLFTDGGDVFQKIKDKIQTMKDIKKHDDDDEFFKLGDGQSVYGNLDNENVKDLIKNGLPHGAKPVAHPKKFLRH